MWRDMLGQWEQLANSMGGEAMKSEAFVQAMGGATGAAAQGQQATHEVMTRWLAAMNMPSRAEFADLSARLARIEEAIQRVEGALSAGGPAQPAQHRPRPRRTRSAPRPAKAAKP